MLAGSNRTDCAGWSRRLRVHQKTRAASEARPTTLPTTPPAIGPAFDDFELELELSGAEEDAAVPIVPLVTVLEAVVD
jgi:hypothetical protein